jgi:hypothetical protein
MESNVRNRFTLDGYNQHNEDLRKVVERMNLTYVLKSSVGDKISYDVLLNKSKELFDIPILSNER